MSQSDRSAVFSLPAMSDSSWLRLFFVLVLYLARGVPIGVFYFAIPSWLAANGKTAGDIGLYLTATSLPWSLKFINGFLMDRYAFLPMGRRRAWLISAQSIMVAGLLALAIAGPGHEDIAVLAVFSFIINAATTYQDVAIDGIAVDLVPDEERARANGMMFGGQSIGMAGGAAATGNAIAAVGLPVAMLLDALFVGAILLVVMVFRERTGERLLPWTRGETSEINRAIQVEAWWPLLRTVAASMFRRSSLLHAGAMIMGGAVYGLIVGIGPLVAIEAFGWSDAQYSSLSGTGNLIAGVLGIIFFGMAIDRIGSKNATMIGFALTIAAAIAFLLAKPYWSAGSPLLLVAFVVIILTLIVWTQVSQCASAMKICSIRVAATQFSLYMAISNAGISLATAGLGGLDALGGLTAMILAFAAVGIGGILLTLAQGDLVPLDAGLRQAPAAPAEPAK